MVYNLEDKHRGELIKSDDWNDVMDKIRDKVDKDGGAMTGSLTIDGNLGIRVNNPDAPLAIKKDGASAPVGITQNQKGGTYTMELTTADGSGLQQATRILLRGGTDNADIEFYRGARGSEERSMIIKGDTGNVGIRVNNPDAPLAIKKDGASAPVGITQNQKGGTYTMELTTADGSGLQQATRILLRGGTDNADIEFYRGARDSEERSMIIKGDTGNVVLHHEPAEGPSGIIFDDSSPLSSWIGPIARLHPDYSDTVGFTAETEDTTCRVHSDGQEIKISSDGESYDDSYPNSSNIKLERSDIDITAFKNVDIAGWIQIYLFSNKWIYLSAPEVSINGSLHVIGEITTTEAKPFLIDHPLEPEKKILRHFSVESPEVLCLYRGSGRLSAEGEAIVQLPDYFKALTKESEATVTITAIGKKPFVSSYEWNDDFSAFTVYGAPDGRISYMVLAERDDPAYKYSKKPVESDKPDKDRGKYFNAHAYGKGNEFQVGRIVEPKKPFDKSHKPKRTMK